MTTFDTNNIINNALNPDKYAMYLRKSRADVELEAISHEETLARHKEMLFTLADRHGIAPSQITIYHEIVSGDSIDDRPEMQRLLRDVHANTYKGVLVFEVERLARGNTKDQGEVAEAFQFSGTLIITPAKIYDPNNEFDQEYFEFGLFMSRREYKTIRRRLEAGKLQSVREGNYIISRPPYGFDVKRTSKKDRFLIEKPEESRIVKMIFDWYTDDKKPTSWIAKQLTLMGIPTSKKAREWTRASVKEILHNVHYTGKVSWGEQQTIKEKDPETGKIVKKRKKTGTKQIYEGKHKGFISEEQFMKVQDIYGTHDSTPMNAIPVNPLSGILLCARCGCSITHQSYPDNRVSRYQHPRGVYKCKMKSLPVSLVIETLIKALNEYIANFEILLEQGNPNVERDRQEDVIAAMEYELSKQERMKKRMFDSWEADDGTYTKEEFIERKQMYTATIDDLKKRIAEAKQNTPAPTDYAKKIETIHALIDCINNPEIDVKSKNQFLKRFIDKITFDVIDYGVNKGGEAVMDVYLK